MTSVNVKIVHKIDVNIFELPEIDKKKIVKCNTKRKIKYSKQCKIKVSMFHCYIVE